MAPRPLSGRERWLIAGTALLALAAPIVAPAWRDALEGRPAFNHDTRALDWDRYRVLDQGTIRIWYTGSSCMESVDWDVYYGREYVAINVFERDRAPREDPFSGILIDCLGVGVGKVVDVDLALEDLGERTVIPGPYLIDL